MSRNRFEQGGALSAIALVVPSKAGTTRAMALLLMSGSLET
jgi:hypothetical protein